IPPQNVVCRGERGNSRCIKNALTPNGERAIIYENSTSVHPAMHFPVTVEIRMTLLCNNAFEAIC
ncbi:MAG: hypothetical protein IJO91_10130, partial [Oscillospiraceae bacterium]|nr:hypothetical protein [Oscillospiraceae bacterium]